VPGQVEISANFNNGSLENVTPQNFKLSQEEISKRFTELPSLAKAPLGMDFILKKAQGQALVLYYNLAKKADVKINERLGLITPYPNDLVEFKRESLYTDKQGNFFGKITLDWDGEYEEPPYPLPTSGKFNKAITFSFLFNNPDDGQFYRITKSFSAFDTTGADSFESMLTSMKPYGATPNPNKQTTNTIAEPDTTSLWSYLLFAFLGGLILNVMPCVLPVISIKLFGLISHSSESHSRIFKHNLFYTLGVLATFMTLAGTIVLLKSTGEQVGWGFQLQSPIFIALTIIVLFVFSLNLFGLFEFATPGGRSLGNVKTTSGFAGDFFGGVIATILSTPCSAPFLGTALTFAFTSSTSTVFLIFAMIGMGLSFPFLLTGLFPATIKVLPKPGMWMEHVKKFLGLTLLLTIIWLFDVFISLTTGNTPILKLITALTLFFFAFYVYRNIAKKVIWKIIYFALPVLMTISLLSNPLQSDMPSDTGSDLLNEKKMEGLPWQKWSEQTMQEMAANQELVFVDFTAKWCFTCKVNEKLVINTDSFKALVQEKDIKLLLGDWTKYDPVIGAYLKKHGYVGVPAYFIQKRDGTLIKLGETITLSKIKSHLN
jgi:thiol:disulfide interchange protein